MARNLWRLRWRLHRQGAQQQGYSALVAHEAMGMLRTQDVMVQIGYPLSAGDRHI